MKLFNKKEQDNRGFSLVELIIVIAIMAILVGIVGTQVIPYLNRSRQAKDLQIINSFCTAAVTAYSINVEDASAADGNFLVYGADTDTKMQAAIKEHAGYDDIADIEWSSSAAGDIDNIRITIDSANHVLTAEGVKADGSLVADFTVSASI